MKKKIVIAGTGFAGMWAALSAARAISMTNKSDEIEVICVSPLPSLVIRPRLYESIIQGMAPELMEIFNEVGVKFIQGKVNSINSADHQLTILDNHHNEITLVYDKFILATGSDLFLPPIPGLKEYAFNVDQLDDAKHLETKISTLAEKPYSKARNTVVVVGAGFTGLETATEMPARLKDILGGEAEVHVVLVERAEEIGPDLGPGPRDVIKTALAECGVETITGASALALDQAGIRLSNDDYIEADTIIWTAGARANQLSAQLLGDKDPFGRVVADQYLHAPQDKDVFVTGDVAHVATDDRGNVAAMSCQHALSLGRVAGYNAAAELVGLALHPYSQPKYVTCLDLGPWGAVYTEGWEREVVLIKEDAKNLKKDITTKWIYPPVADREQIFAVANPDYVIVP